MGRIVALIVTTATFSCTDSAWADQPTTTTTVCELKAAPEKFNGMVVEVRSEVVGGIHTGGLVDESCSAFILFGEDLDLALRRGQIACGSGSDVELLMPHVLNWKDASSLPAPVTLMRDQALARLLHALSDRHPDDRSCMRQRAVATVIGRFDYERCKVIWVRAGSDDPPKPYGAGYGPFRSGHSQLVLQSVKDVTIGPNKPCWLEAEKKSRPTEPR
jgi:hypothetical protein